MTLLSFAVLIIVAQQTGEEISDFDGLGKRSPFLAFAMLIGMLSLAGLPFTAGFLGKFFIFYAAVLQRQITLIAVGVIAVGCGFYYYLKVVRAMYWPDPTASYGVAGGPRGARLAQHPPNRVLRLALTVRIVATIWRCIYPQALLEELQNL